MDPMVSSYIKQVSKHFLCRANWPPQPVDAGDFGVLKSDGCFYRMGNIAEDEKLQIKFRTRTTVEKGEWTFDSNGGAQMQASLAADAVGTAAIDIEISFTDEHSVFFWAVRGKTVEIADRAHLEDDIVRCYEKKVDGRRRVWDRRYVVVVQAMKAVSTTILVSQKKGATAVLSATRTRTEARGKKYPFGVVGGLDIDLKKSKGVGIRYVTVGDLTPLMILAELSGAPFRRKRLRGPTVEQPSDVASERLALVDLAPEDYRLA